jgi:hypothetical protein
MPAVAILYGLGEGKLLRKPLCAALAAKGFDYTEDLEKADVILAHSGGVLHLPPGTSAKVILIAGGGYGYRGSAVLTMAKKVWMDFVCSIKQKNLSAWFVRSCINFRYLVMQPRRLVRMWREARIQRYKLPELPGRKVAIVAFRNDPWSSHLGDQGLHFTQPYAYISMDCLHDDIWANPQDYATVIQYLYES